MQIRNKLLILLLSITLIPLVLVSWQSYVVTRDLGAELAARGREAAARRLTEQLRQMSRDSAAILRLQKQLVELALVVQAKGVERRLTGPVLSPRRVFFAERIDSRADLPPGMHPSTRHLRSERGRKPDPLPITYEEQVILLAPGVRAGDVAEDITRIAGMTRVYRDLHEAHPGLFFWQFTGLESGVYSSYPGKGGYPAGYDPRRRPWYRNTRAAGRRVWTSPIVDASTRQLTMSVSMPVRWPDGRFAGVTAIDVEILSILEETRARTAFSEDVEVFLVDLAPQEGHAREGIRIIAHRDYGGRARKWNVPIRLDWLASRDGKRMAQLIGDMEDERSGFLQMPYLGRDSLWAYESLGDLNAYLLFVIPLHGVTIEMAKAEAMADAETKKQLQLAAFMSGVMILIVAGLAIYSSRTVTERVRELAAVARRIARGDFEARAAVGGRDELSELAEAFNAMVPQLADRIRVRRSLNMAMEVQRALLPAGAPSVQGFDVAGFSAYCDETGGDYYDFVDLSEGGGERVGVAVGDVSGHGVAAALLMATVRALLRSRATQPGRLAGLMDFVNRRLVADARAGRFITLFYMVLDGSSPEVRWVNAGHAPAIVYDAARDSFEELPAADIPLGINPGWTYREFVRGNWAADHVLLLGTDGIWETRDPEGRMFGKEAVREVVRMHAGRPAVAICEAIQRALSAFRQGHPQHDDVTMVVIKGEPLSTASRENPSGWKT